MLREEDGGGLKAWIVDADHEEGPVLVVGGDGIVGGALVRALRVSETNVWCTTRRQSRSTPRTVFLDLARPALELPTELPKFRVAILCAAIASVEACRLDPAQTRRVNVEHTTNFARRLIDDGAFVIFLSSDTVFDGQTPAPTTAAPTNPQTEYGRQKAEVESRLLGSGRPVAVIRLAKVVPPRMPLFISWLSDLKAGRTVTAFSDAIISPVSLQFATEVLVRLAQRRPPGITHATACGELSYASAARHLATRIGVDPDRVTPVVGSTAQRVFPPHSALDLSTLSALDLKAPAPTDALDHLDLSNIR